MLFALLAAAALGGDLSFALVPSAAAGEFALVSTGSPYVTALNASKTDGRPIVVACQVDSATAEAARWRAVADGARFAEAGPGEGFDAGVHRIVRQAGAWIFDPCPLGVCRNGECASPTGCESCACGSAAEPTADGKVRYVVGPTLQEFECKNCRRH